MKHDDDSYIRYRLGFVSFYTWRAKAERLFGETIDMNDEIDGYSIESAHASFMNGDHPHDYVKKVVAENFEKNENK